MADEYRLSIGIDASDAARGADTAKAALDQIGQKAESTVVKVDKLEVSLTKVVDAAGKVTVFKDVQRTLQDTGAAAEQLTSATEALKQKNEEFATSTDKVKAVLQETASATDLVKEVVNASASALKTLKNESKTTVTSLKETAQGVASVAKAADLSTTSVKGMSVTLADLLKSQEQAGDYGAKQFLDMAAGADSATGSLDTLKGAAEDTAESLEGMVPEFSDWNEYARGMEVVVSTNEAVAKTTAEAEAILDSFGPAMQSAGRDAGFLSAEMAQLLAFSEENAKYWQKAKDSLFSGFEQARDAIVEAEDATGGFSHKLALMAEDMAHAGEQVEAMRLMDLSEQFKALEIHIRDALAPNSELLKEFEESLGMTRGEVYNLYEAFGKLLADSTELQQAFRQGTVSAEEYSTQFAEIEGRVASLLPKLLELRGLLQSDAGAQGALKEVTSMSEQLLAQQRRMPRQSGEIESAAVGAGTGVVIQRLGAAAAGMAGVGFGAVGISQAMSAASDYEAQLVRLRAAMSLTEEQTASMREEFRALGDEFGNTTIEEATASLSIAAKGFRETAENTEVLAAANHMARASFMELQSAAQILPQIMSAFKLEAGDAQSAAETLTVATHGNAEAMYMMAMMAGRVGPQLEQAGISLDDFAAASATLSESIGGGSRGTMRAMMGLTQLITRLTNVTPDLVQKMGDAEIKFDAMTVKNKGLIPVLAEIIEKTKGNKAALIDLLGSETAATTALTLYKDEGKALADQQERLTEKSRIMAEQEKRVSETWKDSAKALKDGLNTRMTESGAVIKKVMLPALQALVKYIDVFYNLLMGATVWVAVKGFITTTSGLLKLLQIDFAATAASATGAMGTMARVAVTTGNVIKTALGGLGKVAIAGFIGYNFGKFMREYLMESIPAFDEYTSLVATRFIEMFAQIGRAFAVFWASLKNMLSGMGSVLEEMMGKLLIAIGEKFKDSKIFGFLADDLVAAGEKMRKEGAAGISQYTKALEDAAQPFNEVIDSARAYGKEMESVIAYQNSEAGEAERAAKAARDHAAAMGEEAAAGEELYETSENLIQAMRQIVDSDPRKALERQMATIRMLQEEAQKATNLPPGLKEEFISAATKKIAELNRNLSETTVALHNLALAENPITTFWNNLAKGIDPARDALVAMEEQIKRISYLLEHKQVSEAAAAQAVQMAAESYLQAVQAGTTYEQKVRALTDTLRPAEVIQRELNQRLEEAARLLGVGSQAYAEYAKQAKATAEQQLRMTELQSNALLQLTAKYDPLIANELERQKALIEMDYLLDKANLSEQDRLKWAEKAGQVINEQYDRQARQLRGHITLADAWKKAWESAIERIDGAFADLWKSMFGGMDSFKEALKDTAKQIVAEIAHAKITRPLIMKAGEYLTKVPKVGEIFGDLGKQVLGKLEGGYASSANRAEWEKLLTTSVENGVSAAMSACMGEDGGGAGALLGKGIEGIVDDVIGGFDGLKDDMNAALDDFSGMVMNKVKEQVMGSGPGSAAGTSVVGGGGWMSQFGNALMAGKFGKSLATLSTSLTAFGMAFKGGLSTWMAGGGYSSMSQVALGAQSGVAGWGSMAGQAVGGAGFGMASGWATDSLLGSRGSSGRNMAFSAAGGIIGSLWGVPGALIGGAVGSLVDNIIGGGEKVKDYGYELSVKGGEVLGEFYTKVKKYGSWFSSSNKTRREDLDWWDPVLRQMQGAFKQTRDTLLSFQKELGGSVDAIKNFSSFSVQIGTKGKNSAQVEAEVAQAQIDLMGRQIQAYLGSDKGWNARGLEGGDIRSLADAFVAYAQTKNLPAGNKTTPRVDETRDDILPTAFREMLNTFLISGEDLIKMNPDLSKAGKAFRDSMHYTAEFLEAFKQLATLTIAINMKPSVQGLEMYQLANATLTEQYKKMAEAAVEVADMFDGTLESITQVTDAFVAQRTAAVQLAMALHQAKEEVTKMFSATAETIRESLMEPDEVYTYRKTKAEELAQQMRETTDPGELTRLANEINSIVSNLYSGLDESQREAMAPGFLTFLDGVEEILAQSVQEGLDDLDTSALTVNEQVLAAMGDAAEVQSTAATSFGTSVTQFSASVQTFANAVNAIQAGVSTATASTRVSGVTIMSQVLNASREVNA